jgi:hypothetical protein
VEQIDLAENCFLSYLSWEKNHALKPIALETPLVSELHRYGGTADFYGLIDGVPSLLDFKTGKAIYPEHFIQLAGYAPLLIENRLAEGPIEAFRVLNIPRGETESFDEKVRTALNAEWIIFKAALAIYSAKKDMGK